MIINNNLSQSITYLNLLVFLLSPANSQSYIDLDVFDRVAAVITSPMFSLKRLFYGHLGHGSPLGAICRVLLDRLADRQ